MIPLNSTSSEIRFQGTAICSGIAIGYPFLFAFSADEIPEFSIHVDEIENEVNRYLAALDKSRNEVAILQKQLEIDGASEAVLILETHLQIMKDDLIAKEMTHWIRIKKKNAEFIFHGFMNDYEKKLSGLSEEMFREKMRDVRDISMRIIRNLKRSANLSLAEIPLHSVVFAEDLVPSETAEAKKTHVCAFVTESGGKTSHAAIIARGKGIPYVSNVSLRGVHINRQEVVIVDGRKGEVIIHPTKETLLEYQSIQDQIYGYIQSLNLKAILKAETLDGFAIKITANIELTDEIELMHHYKGDGVGLYRSEYLCLSRQEFPSEQEQFNIYQKMVLKAEGLPVTIRIFDVGGDKYHQLLKHKEANPFLGCRALRYLLQNPEVLKTQFLAILKASAFGPVKILLPMVTTVSELKETKKILLEQMAFLDRAKTPYDRNIELGCMIEVPSAAITCDELAKNCDFFSIGTNDLVQYTLAVDRGNPVMNYLYNPADLSVLRLIKIIISEAKKNNIPVSVCGEIAADPRFIALLLGLGVHELSCAARLIPVIKNAVRQTNMKLACKLADDILEMSTSEEINDRLSKEYQAIVPQNLYPRTKN